MILKRLATNIKKQDWFSVSLEFAILVLGIYLGLQVSEWQSQREAKKTQQQLMLRLTEDLKNLERQNIKVITSLQRQLENFDKTIEFVKQESAWQADYSTWRKHLQPLMGYPNPVVVLPVYQEIVATAQYNQLEDQQFRSALTSFVHQLEDTNRSNDALTTLYTPAYQNLLYHLVDRQEFPKSLIDATQPRKIQLMRDLYTMRNTVSLVKIFTNSIVKDAADLHQQLAQQNQAIAKKK